MTSTPRRLALISTGRADYFLLRTVGKACLAVGLDVRLLACGGHFDATNLYEVVLDDFGDQSILLPTHIEGDLGISFVRSASNCLAAVGQALEAIKPDIVVVLGDRFETLPAAFAAVQLGLPLAHLHGGEISEGALDDSIRHAISKLAHLHFVSAGSHASRLWQMGEEPSRIHVVGAPGLDLFHESPSLSTVELCRRIGMDLADDVALITIHPETVGPFDGRFAVDQVRAAFERSGLRAILTAPNQDRGRDTILASLEIWAEEDVGVSFVRTLGDAYVQVLRSVGLVVGNSSSGLIEAASVPVPVVDLGERQTGRLKPPNVISSPFETGAILSAIKRARSQEFRDSIRGLANPYGDGFASERIASLLASVELDDRLLRKRFVTLDHYPDT